VQSSSVSPSGRSSLDGSRLPFTGIAALALAVLLGLSAAMAQSISGPSDVSIAHSTKDENQTFSEGTWVLSNASVNGATATWSCGPFANVAYPQHKADCLLELRLISKDAFSEWKIVTGADSTDIALNDNTASVQAKSTFSGGANIGLTVTFVQQDYSVLSSGSYRVTVTGTITAN
jgi:hypothetical protein